MAPVSIAAASSRRSRSTESIEWMQLNGRRGLARLVRLQMADEMPPERNVGRFADLLQGLLDLVLAEIVLAGGHGGPDVVGAEGLRDGDEGDLGRAPGRRGVRPRRSVTLTAVRLAAMSASSDTAARLT